MSANEKKSIVISFILAALSGVLIFILDNYFQVQRDWGLASNPFLSYVKASHYLTTPFVLVSIGFIVKEHIKRKMRNFKRESKKITGIFLIVGFCIMCFSGQALLFITDEKMKLIDQYIHGISGVLTLFTLLIHLKTKMRVID